MVNKRNKRKKSRHNTEWYQQNGFEQIMGDTNGSPDLIQQGPIENTIRHLQAILDKSKLDGYSQVEIEIDHASDYDGDWINVWGLK